MITLQNITKIYKKKRIIDNLNLELPNVGLVLFKGINGSGKSTLLNIISNRINYDGKVIFSDDINIKKDLYYSFSEDVLYANLNVKQKTDLLLNSEEIDRFNNYITKFNLEYILNRKIFSLSSGEKQKLELIYVFSKEEKIILIDEPFEFIDRDSKPLFINEIIKLSKKSLIIETCHSIIHESDIIIHFDNGLINKEIINDTLGLKNYPINKKINHHVFKNSFKIFPHKPLKFIIPFNLILLIFSFILNIFINVSILNDRKIFDNVFSNYSVLTLKGDKEHNAIEYHDSKKSNGHKYFDLTKNYNVIPKDDIIYNGENYQIKDYEIFISDYIYDCKTKKTDYFFYNHNQYNYPIISNSMKLIYDPDKFNISLPFDKNKIKPVFKIYRTDYINYLPNENDNKEEKEMKLTILKDRIDNYYNFAVVNKKTFTDYFNTFNDELTKEEYINKYNNKVYTQNILPFIYYKDSTVSIDIALTDFLNHYPDDAYYKNDEFFCDFIFGREYLNLPYEWFDQDEYWNKYYDFQFEDLNLHLKLVKKTNRPITEMPYNGIVVSFDTFKTIYQQLDIKHKYYLGSNNNEQLKINTPSNLDDIYNNLNNYDFSGKEIYKNQVILLNSISESSSILILVLVSVISILLIIYFIFFIRPQYKIEKSLLYKNYNKFEVITLNYLPRIILIIITISMSILLSSLLFEPIMKLLGVLL